MLLALALAISGPNDTRRVSLDCHVWFSDGDITKSSLWWQQGFVRIVYNSKGDKIADIRVINLDLMELAQNRKLAWTGSALPDGSIHLKSAYSNGSNYRWIYMKPNGENRYNLEWAQSEGGVGFQLIGEGNGECVPT